MKKLLAFLLVFFFSIAAVAYCPFISEGGVTRFLCDIVYSGDATFEGDATFGGDVTLTTGDVIGRTAAYTYIPIEWCHDGAVPPAIALEVASGSGTVMAREFGGAAGGTVQDVVCPWEVPEDIVASSGIKFAVTGIITNATGPTTVGVSFKLSGYSIGDNDPLSGTFGAEVESARSGVTMVQYDRLQSTDYSAVVTVTDLAAGEEALLHFERDTAAAADTYVKPIGVTGIRIKYERLTAGF